MSVERERRADCLETEMLAAFVDGTIDAADRARVEEHVADCEDCYEALLMIEGTVTALAADKTPGVAPPVVEAARPETWTRRRVLGVLAAAAAIVLLVVTGWRWLRPDPLDRAVATLASAKRDTRFTDGRLSIDPMWAPPAPVLRAAAGDVVPYDVRGAALALQQAAASDTSGRGRHAQALAYLAAGDFDAAVDAFDAALVAAGGDIAAVHSDLAAALIERHRRTGRTGDLERALVETDAALAQAPAMLAALFNRAVALESLGRSEAPQAWQTYVRADRDQDSAWVTEAKRRASGR